MFSLFHTFGTVFIFTPLYNALVYLVGVIPGGDVGVAVIVFTLGVRLILLPLSQKAQKTQAAMRVLQPQLNDIKKKHEKNPQLYMSEMQKIYKEAGVSPFSSILLLLIQLPILIGIYQVFWYGHLGEVNAALLYPFVHAPVAIQHMFLGFIDMYGKSSVLALLAGVSQFAFAHVMPVQSVSNEKGFANDFAQSMQMQMKYVLPVVIVTVAYSTSAAIALYLIVSNLASIAQEVYNRRTSSHMKYKV
jgi:YidC/Oxa1 family membrane protein insertase